MEYHQKMHQFFSWFLGAHFVLWAILICLRTSIPMDTAEALVWGGEWTFGTNKHPFLSGWVIEGLFQTLGSLRFTAAIASALCTTVGLWAVWHLARLFVSPQKAVFAAALLEGCLYYGLCATEYNVNVLSVALVPLFLWRFYRATQTQKVMAWLGGGVLAAALMLTKYTNGVFLCCAAVYLIFYARQSFSRIGFYMAVLVGAGLCLPHLMYLIQTDFAVLSYYGMRAGKAGAWYHHLWYPLQFLGAQVLALYGLWLACLYFYKRKALLSKAVSPYVLIMGLGPLVLCMLVSFIGGIRLKSMWGFACLSLFPLMVMMIVHHPPLIFLRRFVWTLLVGQVVALAVVNAVHISPRKDFNAKEFALKIAGQWEKTQGTPLAFVGGDIWLASQVSLNLPNRPRVFIEMDPIQCPWLDEKAVRAKGVLVLSANEDVFSVWQEKYGLVLKTRWRVVFKNAFGKTKTKDFWSGILLPQQDNAV